MYDPNSGTGGGEKEKPPTAARTDGVILTILRVQMSTARYLPAKEFDRESAGPPHSPGTYHYGPKMYLRVSQTQSHLFPSQPLGCTAVIALCARVPLSVQPVPD